MMECEDGRGTLVRLGGASALARMGEGGPPLAEVGDPFAQQICLFERVVVSGAGYQPGYERVVEELAVGDELTFVRDHGNAQSCWAVRAYVPSGERLGWAPCECNEIVARLMDAGKRLYGKVSGMRKRGRMTVVEMDVYLDD